MKFILFGLSALSLLFTQVMSVEDGTYTIYLKSRTFTPEPGFLVDDILNQPGAPTSGLIHLYLQFLSVPTVAQRGTVEGLGFEFVAFIGSPGGVGIHIMASDVSVLPDVSNLPNARWAGPIEAMDKVDPRLRDPNYDLTHATIPEVPVFDVNGTPESTENGGARIALNIQFYLFVTEQEASDIIVSLGGEVLGYDPSANLFLAAFQFDLEETIAAQDSVLYVSVVDPPLQEQNDDAIAAANVLPLTMAPYNLDGTGVTITVYDGGIVDDHPDFDARVLQRDLDPAETTRSHAIHVCGTCCGDGANSNGFDTAGNQNPGTQNQWRGVAPGVMIRSFGNAGGLFTNNAHLAGDFTTAINNGIDLATMSLGSGNTNNCANLGFYSAGAAQVDGIVTGTINGQRLIYFVAAGNLNNDVPLCAGANPDFDLITSPATAKNTITVGAINSVGNTMTDFSGWGPTDDGRVKPDIVAPGCTNDQVVPIRRIISTDIIDVTQPGDAGPNGNLDPGETQHVYRGKCGTSMATPLAAGIAALLIEQWQMFNGAGTRPLPHTVKAIMIHTAQDLGRAGPDYEFGWGAVDAQAAVDLVIADDTADLIQIRNSVQGDVDTFMFNSCGTEDVRVTLVWDDPPAAVGAAIALVNDLDLRLTTPAGVILQPLVLNPAMPQMAAVPGNDAVNNVEMIIAPGQCGMWQATVTGTRVGGGGQDYTLITPNDPAGPPGLTCPADTTVSCGGDSTSVATGMATAMATCGVLDPITESDAGSLCDGLIIRTWTARNNYGQATCNQVITPDYNIDPVIDCPADVTIECIEDNLPSNTGVATATNECGPVEVVPSDGMLSGACGGSFTRAWIAINECDNIDTCDQVITVDDTIAPEITCPPDATIKKCGDDISSARLGTATANDNCIGEVTITESDRSVSSETDKNCPDFIIRTWTATDECGNENTCEQVIQYEAKPPSTSYLCFSGENSVEIQGKGLQSIDSLEIGDFVRVHGDNKYAQVYSLGHWNKQHEADFIQITAKSTTAETTIEATANHLLYALNGSTFKAIPASDVKVGDLMVTADGTPARVIQIGKVKRSGVFAPFTTTGDIIVSGLVASNYATIYNEQEVGFPVSFQWMAHAFTGIHRMACRVNFDWCKNEAYTADGIPTWIGTWHAWFGPQGTGVQTVIMALMLPTLLAVSILENMFQSSVMLCIFLLSGFAFAIAKKRGKVWKAKSV